MNPKFEPIEIPISKKKIFLLILVALLFAIFGIFFINIEKSIVGLVVGIVSILFGVFATIFLTIQFFKSSKGIVIDNQGVTNIVDANLSQTIRWKDIYFAEIRSIASNKMLLIHVSNPEEYMDREPKRKRQGLNNNFVLCGTPFVIPSSLLDCKLEYLRDIILSEIKKRNNLKLI